MRKITTRQLTFAALFAALAVLLSVHPFTFYIVPSVRITFREVPIYLCSVTLGPVFGGLCSFIADTCGTFISNSGNRITFREIPIFLCSFSLGPVMGGLCAFIADLCGTFISSSGNAWNPMFALNAVLIGVLPGLIYRLLIPHMKRIWATCLAIIPTNILVSLFLTSLWLHILHYDGGLSYWALLLSRLPLVAVMTVIHIILVMLLEPLARRGIEGGASK